MPIFCVIYIIPLFACLFGHWQQLQTHEMQYHRKVLNNLEVCREILFRLKKEYRFGFQIGLGKFLVLICKMKRKISHVTWKQNQPFVLRIYIWEMIHFGSLEKSSGFFCLKMEAVLQF